MKPLPQIRSEFDRIADLSRELPDVLGPYEAGILDRVPAGIDCALDIGCGTGAVARRLASKARHVVAVDLSSHMIDQAKSRSAAFPNIEFHIGHADEWLGSTVSYDCISAIAVLHHMPLEPMIGKIKHCLRAGGLLLIVDMLDLSGWRNLPQSAVAWPVGAVRNLIVRQRLGGRAFRQAWRDHGRGETYLTIAQAREIFGSLLPGCEVRHHLLWRYSVVWEKGVGC